MTEGRPRLHRKTQLKPLTAASLALLAACSPAETLSQALRDSATSEVFEHSPEGNGNLHLDKLFQEGWSVQVSVLQSGSEARKTGSVADIVLQPESIEEKSGTLDVQGIIQHVFFARDGQWDDAQIGQRISQTGQVYIYHNEGKQQHLTVISDFSSSLESGSFSVDTSLLLDSSDGSVDLFMQDETTARFHTASKRKVYSLIDSYNGIKPDQFRAQVNEIDYGISRAERDFNLDAGSLITNLVIVDAYKQESHAAYVYQVNGTTVFISDNLLLQDLEESDTGNFDHNISYVGYHEAVHSATTELSLEENAYLKQIYSQLEADFFKYISDKGDHADENLRECIATYITQIENPIIQERIAAAPERIQRQYAVLGAAIGRVIISSGATNKDVPEVVKKIFFATEPYVHLIQ